MYNESKHKEEQLVQFLLVWLVRVNQIDCLREGHKGLLMLVGCG